jgi:hypothetical protein
MKKPNRSQLTYLIESLNRCLADARYHRQQAKKPGRLINDAGLARAFTQHAAKLAAQIKALS